MNTKITIQTIFIFGLFVLMFGLLLSIFLPFSSVILWSVFLYVVISPLHRRITSKINPEKRFFAMKRHLLAVGFSVGTGLLIIGPLIYIGFLLVQQLLTFLKEVENFIVTNPVFFSDTEIGKNIAHIVNQISFGAVDLSSIDIKNEVAKIISHSSNSIFTMGAEVIKNLGSFVVSFFFIIFSLYFFYLDADYLASIFAKAIPINPSYMTTLSKKFSEITRHLFSGYFLVALYQGLVAFILMSIFGVNGALLFSVVLMLCSFVPILGAATIWVPVGISVLFTQGLVRGMIFLILSGVCISLLDNFIRPLFLKDRIKVHPLLIFFAILGGLQLFGFNGLLLGPMIIILFFTVLDILTNSQEIEES